MGLKFHLLAFTVLGFISSLDIAGASWIGPEEIVKGPWGKSSGQFGIEYSDTADTVPILEAVTSDNKIVISDSVNHKQLVFNSK